MTRRDILELIGTTTIAGVASSTVAQSASAQAPEIKRVVLGQAKAAGQSAQFPLAIAESLFAEQALDVRMAYFNSAAEMNEALASGSMHITATGDVPTIGLMAHKGPAIMSRPADRFLLRSRHGRAQGHNRAEADRALSRSMVWMRKRSGSFT